VIHSLVSEIELIQKRDVTLPPLLDLNHRQILIAEVSQSCEFAKVFLDPNEPVGNIQSFDDIYAYYIERPALSLYEPNPLSSFQYTLVRVCL
jgi:hypothetical protein